MSTQEVAIVISALALGLSCFAAVTSWLSFRRGGARVTVDLTVRVPERYADVIVAGHIGLSITNKGLGAVGVDSAIWILETEDHTRVAIDEADEGPSLPLTLSGLHSAEWAFEFDRMSQKVPTGVGRARVIFSLGDGRQLSTPWRELPSPGSIEIDVS